MASKNFNELPKPETLEEARDTGGNYIGHLLNLKGTSLTEEGRIAVTHVGRAIGARMFNENAPWTIEEFQERVRTFE